MRRLVLIRHAKAGPHTSSAEDAGRPLADRGKKDARQLGKRMLKAGLRPDLVLCSPAKRTRQTFERVDRAFEPSLPVKEEPRIYEASTATLLDLVHAAPHDVSFLAMVGHNPGFEDTVRLLLNAEGGAEWMRRGSSMPTGCAVLMESDVNDWSTVEPGTLRLVRVMTPDDED
jgi:phosphohistidine phosphatase